MKRSNKIKTLLASKSEVKVLKRKLIDYQSWYLNTRQLHDLESILNGAFSPLLGFLARSDYNTVIKDVRLVNGQLWPIPISLDVDKFLPKKSKRAMS